MADPQVDRSILNKERHIKYWLRCLKTYLPAVHYTSSDSNRVVLAFFIVSALDLLGALHSNTTVAERADYVDWIYKCQHPEGGFRGFTGTNLGVSRSEENAHWDPANLPATYFALAALVILGDDLSRVERRKCLEWLPKLQRADGSFGETLGEGAVIEGGRDMRFCNCAAGVRRILRGRGVTLDQDIKDTNVEEMVHYIRASETYDGGISEQPYHEAHAGFTYCAIGALSFLDRLSIPGVERVPPSATTSEKTSTRGLRSLSMTLHWLVSRQTTRLEDDEYYSLGDHSVASVSTHKPFHVLGAGPVLAPDRHPDVLAVPDLQELQWAGFNGRCNKVADTCYSWWVGGSLAILKKVHLMDFNGNRRYLLEKTQHIVGGFGKLPGEPPDLLHSYFGLAALATMKEPGLLSLDPTFCISIRAVEHLETLPWWIGSQQAGTSSVDLAICSNRDLAASYHELLEEFSSKDLRTVGNYSLGRLIGKGAFGKVYLATHKLTNGSKVVLKSANKDDSNLAREIHHHRQFVHPHIARLYEVIITENLVWLVLEYCPGDELYNYLLTNGPIPANKVQKIFAQLVGAVAYVHDTSCVHRDLKLENILLDKNGNVKLCDFGFTREYEGKASYLQTFCGTVCYSAPEMLRGEKYAGEKVDVWSLGIILYALLAGELPFDEDDDTSTKVKILTCEPKYPSQISDDAKALIQTLLSKRPLIRPTLTDILANPFLAEHAPQQQDILNLTQPTPFNTRLEKDTLERMRSAGVDIDKVIENVIAQRCDSLAGWWALLIEKEERKEKRRERRRREKESDAKNLRRLSAASTRLERIAPTPAEVDEERHAPDIEDPPRSRGRRERRSISTPHLVVPDLPQLPEGTAVSSPRSATPPPPIEKDSIRSASSSRHRPQPPPKERRRSRGSTLQLVSSNPDLYSPNGFNKRRPPRRHQHPIINQLASIKHWFMDSAKRAKSPASRSAASTLKPVPETSPVDTRRPSGVSTVKPPGITVPPGPHSPPLPQSPRPRVAIRHHRDSLSPARLTPHSSYRRPSTGLRGRKSTSSSVSSIRSIHHVHTHSKASSTSSNSITTSTSTNINKVPRSPHTSVKVLPATPTTSAFPSNIRIVRQLPSSTYNESATFNPPTGLVFAKRKRSPFKGPMLNVTNTTSSTSAFLTGHGHGQHPTNGNHPNAGGSSTTRGRDSSVGGSRSASVAGRTSGEIIEEEEEDEIEEVEVFSPIVAGERTAWGETVIEETIFEGSEGGRAGFVDYTR